MMNAEFIHQHKTRILIPIVYREDYLLALRAMSRHAYTAPYIKMLDRAHAFVHALDFEDYQAVTKILSKSNAFLEPHEGLLKFPPETKVVSSEILN